MKKISLFTNLILLAISFSAFSQPVNLSTTNITSSQAELSWDGSSCAGNVILHYKVAGTAWPGTIINPAVSPNTLTGLSSSTNYEWRVKCGGTSVWSPTQQFVTSAPPATGPTINNAFVSQPILCNGGFLNDEMQIDVNQTAPSTTYACVVGFYGGGSFFVSFYGTNQTSATQLNLTGFNPNVNYYVRLVDSAAYYSGNGGIGSGSSTVGVYDEFGPVLFTEPAQLVATTLSVVNNLCSGDCIAEEDLNISGGTPPYSFSVNSGPSINLPTGTSTYSFVALCANNYDVIVTDSNGCTTNPAITNFSISQILPISTSGTVSQFNLNGFNVSCNGASDGTITAAASGGVGGFTYSIDGVNFQTSPIFDSLSAGAYTITYKDANGCDTTEVLVLNEPPALSGSASITQSVDCFNSSTGEITFVVDPSQPGVPGSGYLYSIDNGSTYQNSNIFNNLLGDSTYNVMVEDNNGCQFISSIYLPEPSQIFYSSILSDYSGYNISCNGASDGEINTTATAGSGGFSYSIDGGSFQNSGLFTGLSAGNFNITYQDANGCTESTQITLNEPGIFTISYTVNNSISCANDCDAGITVLPNNFVGQVLFSLDGGVQQTSPFYTSLCGDISYGTYNLDATDANGCVASALVSISEPSPFVFNTNAVDETCSPPNGQAIINVTSGGTGGYIYEWNTVPVTNTAVANNLSAGTYVVTVTDGNSCSFNESVVVLSSPAFSLSFSTVEPCLGPLSGSATVSTSGSNGSLSYIWSDNNGNIVGSSSPTLDNVPVGTYFVEVTDASGCMISGSVDILPPFNPIVFDTLIVNSNSCFGVNDAQVQIVASGGLQPYTFSNGIVPIQNSPFFGFLTPGTYTFTATDLNGCFVDTIIDVVSPGLLQIDSTHFLNVSCNGASDAEITAIDVSGGTAPFSFSVNGSTHYTNMAYFNSYGPGTYTVEVYDNNNCVAADYIIISEPDELDVDVNTSGWVFNGNSGLYSYQIKCNGDNSGYANLSISGGTAPYLKNLYNSTSGNLISSTSTNNFNSLSAGIYDFEVIDANGCVYFETITYNEPTPITHNFLPTHVTCQGWSNGALTDVVSGGVGNASTYTYNWNTGDTTYSIINLGVGTYTITVVDENNCSSTSSFSINDNNALSSTVSIQDVSCFDYCDGEASVTSAGGVPNIDINGNTVYNYQWDDVLLQTTQNAIGLCVDNTSNFTQYSCIVSDAQGCYDTVEVILNQPDSLQINAIITTSYNFQDISCYGESDGALQATSTGGNPPYDYIWSTGSTYLNTFLSNEINLSAGVYDVTVKDAKGCMDTTTIELQEPDEITLQITSSDVNCFGVFDGFITADADGGTPFNGIPQEYNYSFSNNFIEVTDVSTNINLGPGIYTVTVSDLNGCSYTSESIYISQPSDILSIDLDSTDQSCNLNNGSITSNVDGGTSPYNYLWNNGATSSSLSNLSPGIYNVIVTDQNGCIVNDTIRVVGSDEVFMPGNLSSFDTTICLGESFVINVEEKLGFSYLWINDLDTIMGPKIINNVINDAIDLSVTPDNIFNSYSLHIMDPSCLNYSEVTVTINVDFIDPLITSSPPVEYGNFPILLSGQDLILFSNNSNCTNYTWSWDENTFTTNDQTITIPEVKESNWYYINVEDSQGCMGYDSIYVVVGVLPYEAITPNGDNINDTWTPRDIESYENALVQVYNRWGALVYESIGGENFIAWDGTNNGEDLVVGTYYYIIDLKTGDEPQKGPITIIR